MIRIQTYTIDHIGSRYHRTTFTQRLRVHLVLFITMLGDILWESLDSMDRMTWNVDIHTDEEH